MLRALSVALAFMMAGQAPDDMVLCTSATDCPSGAACEDGVCVMMESEPPAEEEPPPPPPEKKRRVKRQRRERVRDPNHAGEATAPAGEECFRGACGPPVPSTGTGLTVAGGIVTGVSVAFFGSSAACRLQDSPQREKNVCTAIEASIGAVALAVGVPMLVIGVLRKSKFKEWVEANHPQFAVVPLEGKGASASVGFAF